MTITRRGFMVSALALPEVVRAVKVPAARRPIKYPKITPLTDEQLLGTIAKYGALPVMVRRGSRAVQYHSPYRHGLFVGPLQQHEMG